MKIRTGVGIAFAVCAAAVIGAVLYGTYGGSAESDNGEIRTFSSYSEIERTLSGIEEKEPMVYANGGPSTIVEDAESIDGAMTDGAVAKTSERSDTYVQVTGVDESDIIKNDGRYIYYTSRLGYDVMIAEAAEGKTKDVAVIAEEETGIIADDLFLTDGRLIIIGFENNIDYDSPKKIYDYPRSRVTAACIYDVTDPHNPKLIGKYKQNGTCVSSRISDGYLYLVTNDYLDRGEQRIVPSAGMDDNYDKLKPEQISCFPHPSTKAYVVVGSVKVSAPEGKIKSRTKAVLGASDEIYCSGDAIYFTDYSYEFRGIDMDRADERTNIMKASISKGKIDFVKQGSIRGSVLNQFAMDEKDGYFRVAATAFIKGKDVNYLYILNDDLETVGKVRGFAAGEQIKAVRFIGDMAYVITYEQTDPLFVIDLKNPEAPKLLGSVKITGFSQLLVPEGENMLIGIGTSTSEEGDFGEVEDGVKIALFDISDPEKPKVLDSKTYRNWSSDVQYNHKALTVNSRDGWYAIPYVSWEDENGGVLQFRVKGSQLEEMDNMTGEHGIDRSLYMGDYMYGLEYDEDAFDSWKIKK